MKRSRKTTFKPSNRVASLTSSLILTLCALTFGSSYAKASSLEDTDLPSWMTERRIIGSNNLEPVVSDNILEFYDSARVVARLETPDGLGYCSGSRVGENLFLTNFHCQESFDCENIWIHMGYEKGLSKNQQGVFQCSKILASNETHDYALIEVKWVGTQVDVEQSRGIAPSDGESALDSQVAPATASDFPIASLYVGELNTTTPIAVPSHPRGRLKEIDKSADCRILSTEITEISMRETMTHSCDTEGGSSGSPVINRATGAILGLHWGGVTNQNFMIPMASIVADLKTNLSSELFSQLSIIQ